MRKSKESMRALDGSCPSPEAGTAETATGPSEATLPEKARCRCGHPRSKHGVVKRAICYECVCPSFSADGGPFVCAVCGHSEGGTDAHQMLGENPHTFQPPRVETVCQTPADCCRELSRVWEVLGSPTYDGRSCHEHVIEQVERHTHLWAAVVSYLQHKGDCAQWGEVWEWPRHLHTEIACSCGLSALFDGAKK